MPELVLKATGEVISVAPDNLARALASGLYEAPAAGSTAQVSTPAGVADVPIDQLGAYQQNYGDPLASTGEVGALEREAFIDRRHGGAAGAIGTFVEQGLDTATLGGYGLLSDAIAGPGYTENRAERLEGHTIAGTLGTVAGAAAPALLSGGAGTAGAVARATPAGAAARIAEGIVAKAAGRGFVAETAAAAAGYGVEGALFGSGHVFAETILHDKELSAEAFVAGAAEGAMWAGAAGGAGSLLSRGTRFTKNKLDDVMAERASVSELAAQQKAAQKEADAAAKELSKAKLLHERNLNQRGMEELRQKGRLDLVDARAGAKKEGVEFAAEQKLKLEEYRQGGKRELAEIGADARLKIADRGLEKALAQAEARTAVARAKLDGISERLAVEQERTLRAKLVMDGRLEIADTYTGGWKRAAESREMVAASKLEAATIGADARTRVGMADALVRSGRQDAGQLVADMIPARLRTPKAVQAARSDVVTQAARLQAGTDDLIRQADELMAASPGAAADLQAIRNAAAETGPAVAAWSERAAGGADDFADGFRTIRGAEQAQHDLAQAMKGHLDGIGVPSQHLDQLTAGMDEAVAKTDDIVTGAMAKQVDAAAGSAGQAGAGADRAGAAGVADLLIGAAGLPNVDDIPVVGPVLGAYLKFRALHGALGKFGIRVPGPVGRIAQVGAQVQNRASEVVQAVVSHAPAAAKVVERAAPSLASTLSRPLWEGQGEPSEKPAPGEKGDPLRLYKKRLEELERAVGDPEGTRKKIIESIPAPPTVAAAVADAEMRKLDYLSRQVSHDPRGPSVVQRNRPVSMYEVHRFAEHKRAVEDPIGSVKDVIDGRMSPSAAQAVREVYPRLFQAMQEELVEKLSELAAPVGFDRLVRAALVFEIPLDSQTNPRYVAARQAEYAEITAAAQPAAPSGGPQLRLSPQEELGSMRRAMR